MRILIVTDETGLGWFVKQQLTENFTCKVRIAENNSEARAIMPEFLPQLLLCDVDLNGVGDGMEWIRELQYSYRFEVILVTPYCLNTGILRATEIQPANYLFKPLNPCNIFAAIKLVEPRIAADQLGQAHDGAVSRPPTPLNATDLKVIRLILERKTTNEISEALFLSPYTVKNHRHNICRKLGLKAENNALLKWALKNEARIADYHQPPAWSPPVAEC
ncbi:response regulator transcription factor [Parapedobacter koreensis]|uniref:DNA-binding response regulator, NarL/FixJ family, contains REC and HTH domains n=1 Tax=Parapedobacter koreensis TaxID=332977 RepID=A0A1H7NV60_9SPHI|nr:response regulator transcription factor [Parapedobacter koreensis]SEL26767.1 DNA-binding response regulator, NarL/FixJ family, contains REC and HTH domains [Parapedobacter koreensis]